MSSPNANPAPPAHSFTIFVDEEPLEVPEHELTVGQILERSGHTPVTEYWLIEYRGQSDQKITHKDPTEVIHLHERQRFTTLFQGETPVS